MENFEVQYLRLVDEILKNGNKRKSRNGNTLSKFGMQMQFDISKNLPLLTTKQIFTKGVIGELLWFLNGKTSTEFLNKNGIHIWDKNSSREYLDSRGLQSYSTGTCGPVYGFQWRYFNAEYHGPGDTYKGRGVDQLAYVVDLIKHDPSSRRIFMSAWNPEQQSEMCLEPCHVSYQFYVNDGTLSCHMYQRSCDVFLGLPFNIASVSILTYILAKMCNLKAREVTISFGDIHIYESHILQCQEQLTRPIMEHTAKLKIAKNIEGIEDLCFLSISDFIISDYNSHGKIKAEMLA
tara:strand:- start:80 stop:955 length:876 start_codon:yes stop_codon:yes gene_type:complete